MADQASGYLSIAISLLVLIVGMGFQVVGTSRLFRHSARILLTDYGTIITIVFFTAFPHFGGELESTILLYLPTSPSFQTTTGRGWLVDFWNIGVASVFLAIPFAILLTILFYMDHNISVTQSPPTANISHSFAKAPNFHLRNQHRSVCDSPASSNHRLGLFSPRYRNRNRRPSRRPVSQWTYPTSAFSHSLIMRDPSPRRSQRKEQAGSIR